MKGLALRELTLREKLMLIGLLMLAIILAAYQFMLLPYNQKQEQNAYRITELTHTIAQLQTFVGRESDLDRELQSVQAKVEQLNTALPATSELPQFVLSMDRLAAVTGVQISDLRVGEMTDKTTHAELALDLQSAGTLPQLIQLLASLENGARPLLVNGWSFVGGSAQVKLSLQLRLLLESGALSAGQSDRLNDEFPAGRPDFFQPVVKLP